MRIKIGLVQTEAAEDPAANTAKTVERVREAASKGANVVCLQELYRTRYFPQSPRAEAAHLAETIPGESTDVFSRLAKELGAVLVLPLFERAEGGKLYNSAVIADADGTLKPAYRKIHIPHDDLFYEQDYFEKGDRGFLVHETRFGRVSAMICYDQWYPEAARISALKGADILFYPTAIGTIVGHDAPEGDWREAWTTVQRGHAIANSVHLAAVNRVGVEGKLRFWGSSFVSDPFGNVLGRAGEGEEVLVVEADLSRNAAVREDWRFLKERRPDCYGPIAEKERM